MYTRVYTSCSIMKQRSYTETITYNTHMQTYHKANITYSGFRWKKRRTVAYMPLV